MTGEMTVEKVKKIAQLVKVNVDGQQEKFADLFSQTLEYIKILDKLDTKNVEPTYQVTGLKNVFQLKDQIGTISQEEAIQNTKEKDVKRGLFITKAVFEGRNK